MSCSVKKDFKKKILGAMAPQSTRSFFATKALVLLSLKVVLKKSKKEMKGLAFLNTEIAFYCYQ
jgi:hypothetical protein